jgi:hypothetical protein
MRVNLAPLSSGKVADSTDLPIPPAALSGRARVAQVRMIFAGERLAGACGSAVRVRLTKRCY